MRLRKGAVILLCLLFSAVGMFAQTVAVKGSVHDAQGPVAGAQVQFKDTDTGRKYNLKTDKKGNFFSLGFVPGTLEVTVTRDGKVVYTDKFHVTFDEDKNVLDITLGQQGASGQAPAGAEGQQPAQQQQQQGQPQKLTDEQKKQIEEINKKNAEIAKENAKIGNLNTMLKQAQADMQAKNYDAAVQTMEQAEAADNGQHHQILGVLGSAYLGDKKYPEAIDTFNKAIQAASTDTKPNAKLMVAQYYDNLGQAYAKTNKTAEAIDAYNKEAEQDPTHAAQAYYNEGAVLTNTGKTEEANAAFTKAIQADPNRADAYYQRAINSLGKATVDKQGKMVAPPGTVDDFNKYLELDPNGPYAEAAKQMLDSLGAKVTTGFKKGK